MIQIDMTSIIRIIVVWAVAAITFYLAGTPESVWRWGSLALACLAELQFIRNRL